MAELGEEIESRLKGTVFWLLATLDEDGSANVTPVWAHADGGHVIVNTAVGRKKDRNVRRDPRVTLTATLPENPYAWIQIRGRVVELVEGDEAERSIDDISEKYTGQTPYPWRQPGERRVLYRIEPTRVLTG